MLFAYYREAALAAGPLLFDVFDIYQRLLAILAVVAAVVLAWKRGGAGAWLVLGAVLMSALGVVVMAFYLMPEIHMLMDRQQTRTERFDMLHGLSIVVYFAEAMLLVVALSIITLQRPRSAQA